MALQFLPVVPMKRYGVTPYGEALYRVVFSDSRTDLIGGKWPDGVCDYREVRRYPEIHNWVLEKWMTSEEYAGKREEYERAQLDLESGLYTCGPYPSRGEYQLCYVFPYAPGDGEITRIVTAIKLSRDIHPAHRKDAIMGRYEHAERDRSNRFDGLWDNAMGSFNRYDTVIPMRAPKPGERSGFKKPSDMPAERMAKSSPLPTGNNYFGTIPRESKIVQSAL
jgi:hypothetical protein